jgi:hypothetical protein
MFGNFTRKRQQHLIPRATAIAALHQQMRQEFPGAAYLFARTLFNARGMLDDSSVPISQKVARIDEEIEWAKNRTKTVPGYSNASSDIEIAAMRFVLMLLEAAPQNDADYLFACAAFGEIARHGARYRAPNEQDARPPTFESAKRAFAKNGHKSLANCIQKIRTDSVSRGRDSASIDEDVWSIIAMYDLGAEIHSGRFPSIVKQLEGLSSRQEWGS